jgi:phosphoglycerate dehydrogenase-like enzyme
MVTASLTPEMVDLFITLAHGRGAGVKPGIQVVDPSSGYAALASALNKSGSPVLLTGWKSQRLPETFLEDCPGVRYVCRLNGEISWLIPRSLIERGLLVSNWGETISANVAEGALYLILSCLRRAVQCQMNMHLRGGWKAGSGTPASLIGRSIGLHGFGNIGQNLARLLEPFGCRVSAYSTHVPDEILAQFHVRRETSLECLFAENDVVVELAALTPANRGIVSSALLERLRPDSVFVNIARGALVDEEALVRLARTGQVWIGLDVYAQEPLPSDSPLRGLENVCLSPI